MRILHPVFVSLIWLTAFAILCTTPHGGSGTTASAQVAKKPRPDASTITLTKPMAGPEWAIKERQFITEMSALCMEFYHKYYDDQGNLQAVLRWGADDGPDDAFENFTGWPELHALGAPDEMLKTYLKANDAMIVQYTKAKTIETPMPRQGMFYKEFEVQADWMHLGEW
jgi:hypothetical protein